MGRSRSSEPMILHAKLLTPRLRPRLVARSHLVRKLNAGLREHAHRLTLISGPAGFGKSTLAAQWLAQLDHPHSWLSLDSGDNDPAIFFPYLIAALGQIHPGWGRNAQALLNSLPPATPQALITALANDLIENPVPCVLVLDDFHEIQETSLLEAMSYWLDYLPPDLHLILIARHASPLNLARTQARGQITQIEPTSLRFNSEETQAFLTGTMQLDLDDSEIRALAERTGGWPAGLQLAALHRKQAGRAGLPGSTLALETYLLQEVFAQQPSEVQDFLLATSILDRLAAGLCDAVSGKSGSQAMLRRLEESDLFLISLGEEQGWFRYHPVFRDFLRAQAGQLPGSLSPWHRRAAGWYAAHDHLPEAIEHGLAAGEYESTGRWILALADRYWTQGRIARLQGWLLAIPPEARQSQPLLELYLAWTYFFSGRHAAIPDILQGVGDGAQGSDPEGQRLVRGMRAAIRGAVASAGGDAARTIEYGQAALEDLPFTRPIWRSVVGLSLGVAYRQASQPEDALEAFRNASALAEQAGNLSGALFGLGNLAELHLARGDIPAAEEIYRHGLKLAAGLGSGELPITGPMYAGLGELLWRAGGGAEAEAHLRTGVRLCEQGGFPRRGAYLALSALLEARGEAQEAREWREKAARTPSPAWPQGAGLAAADRAVADQVETAQTPGLVEPLSERERELLALIAAGKSNQAIADELVLAVSTIKWHLHNMYGKLGVRSRTQAVARARELALLED